MIQDLCLIVHLALCVTLTYSAFCRLTKMDQTTAQTLRVVSFIHAAVGMGLIFAVASWGFVPNIWTDLLMANSIFYMYQTKMHWTDSVPNWLIKNTSKPE